MTTQPLAFRLALAAAALVASAACTGEANEIRQTDAIAKPSSLVGVESAHYTIARVEDGVLFAARVGVAQTSCGDRGLRRDCALALLDLSRLDLSSEDERLARAHIADGTAVVRGKLVPTEGGDTSALVVGSVWVRRAAAFTLARARAASAGLFVLRDESEACDPSCGSCASLRVDPVGGEQARHVSVLDLSLVGGSLDEATNKALARGETLAHGATLGSRFVAASVYVPFGTPASAPTSPPPAGPLPIN